MNKTPEQFHIFKSNIERITVQLKEFRDSRYMDIRTYIEDNKSWIPSKNGVTFKTNQLNDVVTALSGIYLKLSETRGSK